MCVAGTGGITQDAERLDRYLTRSMIEFLKGPITDSRVDAMCQAFVHLGLRAPSERCAAVLTSTIILVCHGANLAFDLDPAVKYTLLLKVKERVEYWKNKIQAPVDGVLRFFPADPERLKEMKPALYERMYNDEPPATDYIQMRNDHFEALVKTIPLRPNNKSLRGTIHDPRPAFGDVGPMTPRRPPVGHGQGNMMAIGNAPFSPAPGAVDSEAASALASAAPATASAAPS